LLLTWFATSTGYFSSYKRVFEMFLLRDFPTSAESHLMGKRRFIFQDSWDLLWVRSGLFWVNAVWCCVIILLNTFQDWMLLVDNSQFGFLSLYSWSKVITAFAFCKVALERINWDWESIISQTEDVTAGIGKGFVKKRRHHSELPDLL